uniref:Uncharacterized protein n=1 Tax=Globisporangium ultimum (strain ATCC 200006 / CBS 805.95 / DAOM BR144) TaxID=431595 RepID=K3XCX3_GLOUD
AKPKRKSEPCSNVVNEEEDGDAAIFFHCKFETSGTETEEHINVHKAVSIAVGWVIASLAKASHGLVAAVSAVHRRADWRRLHKFVVVSLSLTEYITKLQLDVLKNMQQGS